MTKPTNTLPRAEALRLVEAYSNQPKKTYVRVEERHNMSRYAIEGLETHVLVLHTHVYSKTWAKNTARIWEHHENGAITELQTKAAKLLLAA